MGKPSKKFVSMVLTRLGIVAACVFGSAATPNQSCCGPGIVDPGDGGAGGEGMGNDCFDYASFDDTTPVVTFKANVLPILRNSCGVSASCHGSQAGPVGQPYLGPPANAGTATTAQIDAIFAQTVGIAATRAPTMSRIEAGKPNISFLMHKMDHTLTCPDVMCGAAGCGVEMPKEGTTIAQADRDTVRRWIAQGAKNN